MSTSRSTGLRLVGLIAAIVVSATLLADAPRAQEVRTVDRVIAVVNDEVITRQELEGRVAEVRERLRQQGGAMPGAEEITQRVLENLVVERAQMQLAEAQGIRVDESQVDEGIRRIAEDNRLSLNELRERLASEGTSFARFRDQVRSEIVRARLREIEVESRVQVSDADVDAWLAQQKNREVSKVEYEVAQIFLRLPEQAAPEEVAERRSRLEEIAARARAGESFGALAAVHSEDPDAQAGGSFGWRTLERLPGLFADAIVALEVGGLSPIIRSPAGLHVLKLVDRRGGSDALDRPVRQTRARHILMVPDNEMSEDEVIRRVADLRERLVSGEAEFGALARQFSVDGTAARGGELGWIYEGDTVPAFERAMNALAPGELSQPVRSPFGIHLIQVLERREDSASPERRRQIARQAVRRQRADEAYMEWLAELRDRTYVEYRFER